MCSSVYKNYLFTYPDKAIYFAEKTLKLDHDALQEALIKIGPLPSYENFTKIVEGRILKEYSELMLFHKFKDDYYRSYCRGDGLDLVLKTIAAVDRGQKPKVDPDKEKEKAKLAAIEHANKKIKATSQQELIYNYLCEVHIFCMDGLYRRALTLLDHIVQFYKEYPDAEDWIEIHYSYGKIYYYLDKIEKAKEFLDKVPTSSKYHIYYDKNSDVIDFPPSPRGEILFDKYLKEKKKRKKSS